MKIFSTIVIFPLVTAHLYISNTITPPMAGPTIIVEEFSIWYESPISSVIISTVIPGITLPSTIAFAIFSPYFCVYFCKFSHVVWRVSLLLFPTLPHAVWQESERFHYKSYSHTNHPHRWCQALPNSIIVFTTDYYSIVCK